jgi:hypothetical protein
MDTMNEFLKHPNAKALVRAADDSDPYGVAQPSETEKQACRDDGWRAGADGWKKKDNPYERNGWQWVAWNEGWDSSRKE